MGLAVCHSVMDRKGRTMRAVVLIALVVFTTTLQGCGLWLDRRDAPWDPKPGSGRTMLDQIPNNTGGANQICCGHLRRCEAHQSPRC